MSDRCQANMTHTTVNRSIWPCLSGTSPSDLGSCPLFAGKRPKVFTLRRACLGIVAVLKRVAKRDCRDAWPRLDFRQRLAWLRAPALLHGQRCPFARCAKSGVLGVHPGGGGSSSRTLTLQLFPGFLCRNATRTLGPVLLRTTKGTTWFNAVGKTTPLLSASLPPQPSCGRRNRNRNSCRLKGLL